MDKDDDLRPSEEKVPTCSVCGEPMVVCTTETPGHSSHDAKSPHWAALHLHGGDPEPNKDGLIFFGYSEYTRDMEGV